MALNKELWSNEIAQIFRSDNSFASLLQNYSMWVNGKYVHMPVAGTAANLIDKNLASFPVTGITLREDSDVQVALNTFYIKPIVLSTPIEDLEFDYNKRASVTADSMAQLLQNVNDSLILDMSVGSTVYTGNGTARTAWHADQTGNRSGITFDTIKKAQYLFNSQNLPSDGRILLVPAELQEDIVSLDKFQYSYNLTDKVVVDGTIGKILGFTVVVRDKVLVTTSGDTLKTTQVMTATDNAACLAFSTHTNIKAVGEIKMFEKVDDPQYYSTIISGYVRAVAANRYGTTTPKGVCVLAEKVA